MTGRATIWTPYREPHRVTQRRTILIALGVGAALTVALPGLLPGVHLSWHLWWANALAVYWFSFGGHWVELLFVNVLRPRLPHRRPVQVVARLCTWFAGGALLFTGMRFTWEAVRGAALPHLSWWFGGVLFILVECGVHLVLRCLRRPSFWDGRG